MANGWTLERRKKQSEQIKIWQPWQKSTGAKSVEGKQVVSKNALKHGMRSADVRALQSLLAEQNRKLKDLLKNIEF